MPNSNTKGSRSERELVNYLDNNGWAVLRAPASGAATDRELPDVLAGDGERFLAIEGKASGGNPIYLDAEEVEALIYFAEQFGAEPRLAARWDEKHGDLSYGEEWPGWYLHEVDAVHRTDGGNYRIKKELSLEEGTPITELKHGD